MRAAWRGGTFVTGGLYLVLPSILYLDAQPKDKEKKVPTLLSGLPYHTMSCWPVPNTTIVLLRYATQSDTRTHPLASFQSSSARQHKERQSPEGRRWNDLVESCPEKRAVRSWSRARRCGVTEL